MTSSYANPSPLGYFSEVMTLVVMAGLTIASAATFASAPVRSAEPEVVKLPTVYVVGNKAEVVKLPTVVVVGKRSPGA